MVTRGGTRQQGLAVRARKLKRGRTNAPFYDGRGQLTVSCRPSSSRPWLSSPLSLIPPFMWDSVRERSNHPLWLPPGTLTDAVAPRLGRSRTLVGLHKGWPELAALIPDVDYG